MEGVRELSGLLRKGTNLIHEAPPSRPNHLPRASLPNGVPLEVRISAFGVWGHTSIESITVPILRKLAFWSVPFAVVISRDAPSGHTHLWAAQTYLDLHAYHACHTSLLNAPAPHITFSCSVDTGFLPPLGWWTPQQPLVVQRQITAGPSGKPQKQQLFIYTPGVPCETSFTVYDVQWCKLKAWMGVAALFYCHLHTTKETQMEMLIGKPVC